MKIKSEHQAMRNIISHRPEMKISYAEYINKVTYLSCPGGVYV